MDARITLIRCLPERSPSGLHHYQITLVAARRREVLSVLARTGASAVRIARARLDAPATPAAA